MADSVGMSDIIIPALDEIQNMKVTDLRKKLKAFGLPTNGNKTELIERLQEICMSSKGDTLGLSFDESQISGLDSIDDGSAAIDDDGTLLDQDEQFSPIEDSPYLSSLVDDSKVLESTKNKLNSNTVAMPPKKRVFPKTGSEDGAVVEKKVVLNRTNIAHIDFKINEKTESKPKSIISSNNTSQSEDKKVLTVKSMSAAERLAMRAKRFNVIGGATSTTNSKFANSRNSKQSIVSSSVAPDLDILKKRAARFGQSVSNVMKQIEHKEKLLKRKCKFGANLSISATSSLDEQEKKRQRAERFGIS